MPKPHQLVLILILFLEGWCIYLLHSTEPPKIERNLSWRCVFNSKSDGSTQAWMRHNGVVFVKTSKPFRLEFKFGANVKQPQIDFPENWQQMEGRVSTSVARSFDCLSPSSPRTYDFRVSYVLNGKPVQETFYIIVTHGSRRRVLQAYHQGHLPLDPQPVRDSHLLNNDVQYFFLDQRLKQTEWLPGYPLADFVHWDYSASEGQAALAALDFNLVKKLTHLTVELFEAGVSKRPLRIVSGYHHPEFHRRIKAPPNSIHPLGKAVDFIVDNNGDGRMDDLNGDGVLSIQDTKPIVSALYRLEKARGTVPGIIGVIELQQSEGPEVIVHMDVSGQYGFYKRVIEPSSAFTDTLDSINLKP